MDKIKEVITGLKEAYIEGATSVVLQNTDNKNHKDILVKNDEIKVAVDVLQYVLDCMEFDKQKEQEAIKKEESIDDSMMMAFAESLAEGLYFPEEDDSETEEDLYELLDMIFGLSDDDFADEDEDDFIEGILAEMLIGDFDDFEPEKKELTKEELNSPIEEFFAGLLKSLKGDD